MKISTLTYCTKQGIISLFRNRLMSVASITTIAACLFIIGVFYTVGTNIEFMMSSIENKIGVAVFFKEGTTELTILEIKKEIETKPYVNSVSYISAAQAWEKFKGEYFKGKENLLTGFEGDNPLNDSASLQIFIKEPKMQEQLVSEVEALTQVRYVRQAKEVTNIIQGINSLVTYGSFVLITILLIISVFLISNTVRLAISIRKKEIKIMRYIGAKNSLIKAPFLIEGILIGLFGSLPPLMIIHHFYSVIISDLNERFVILKDYLVFLPVGEVFKILTPVSLVVGILIGLIGSQLTVNKFLKA